MLSWAFSMSSARFANDSGPSIRNSTVLPGLKVGEVFGGVGGTIILRSVGTTAGSNPSLEQTVSTNIDGVRLSCGNALYKSSYNPRPERAPGAQCRNVWVLDGSIHLFRENRM